MQLGFFDRLETEPDAHFRGALRRDLGAGAWLEFVPDWLRGARAAFDMLLGTATWERHQRPMYDRVVEVPRRVAARPGKEAPLVFADSSRIAVEPSRASKEQVANADRLLGRMGSLLSQRYGRELGGISLAHYRSGDDSVAFHGDKLGELRPDTVVAIVSVGARRRFALRPAADGPARGQPPLNYVVGEGDLLVMGGSCQETWEHAIPKAAHAGPRIAVMFRERAEELRPLARSRAAGGESTNEDTPKRAMNGVSQPGA